MNNDQRDEIHWPQRIWSTVRRRSVVMFLAAAGIFGASVVGAVAHDVYAGALNALFDTFSPDAPSQTRVFTVENVLSREELAVDGECWTGSIGSGRPGAYRCSDQDFIRDPCFHARPFDLDPQSYVTCPGDPTDDTDDIVLRADFTKYIQGEQDEDEQMRRRGITPAPPPDARVWFFRTTDGIKCYRLTGTVPPAARGGTPFGCANDGSLPVGGSLYCFEPEEQEPFWTTRCTDISRTSEERSHHIEQVWY